MPDGSRFVLGVCLLALGTLLAVRPAAAAGPALDPAIEADAAPAWQHLSVQAMATRFDLYLPGDATATAAAREALAVVAEVEAKMNEWRPESPLSAVNRGAGGAPVPVPSDLLALLQRAVDIARLTDGAFDPTWAALWGLWDFKAAAPQVPDPAEVARRAALVDYRQVEIDPVAGTVRLPTPGMALGLGGIAKGWALDRAADVLRRHGVRAFFLQAGGQVLAAGTQDGKPWRIGLRDPRGEPDDVFATLEVRDASVSTSGDYERFFVLGGKRYHHVLDPRTGWPTRGVRVAVVVAPEATLADALSKAPMVLGVRKGLAQLRKLGVEGLLVDDRGKVHATAGMAKRLRSIRSLRR